MSRKFTPKVLTANDLLEGDVVYLDRARNWTRRLSDAAIFTDPDTSSAALETAQDDGTLVGVYLADAALGDTGPTPTHFREAFRRRGPSNYAHGKQAEGTHV